MSPKRSLDKPFLIGKTIVLEAVSAQGKELFIASETHKATILACLTSGFWYARREWAKPMRLMRSETSILSSMLREAFDGRQLAVMNKGETAMDVESRICPLSA